MTTMGNLEDLVKRLEDEREIRRTLVQYSHAIDQRETAEPGALSGCFTEDGVWWASIEGPWAGVGGTRHTGREAIEEWFLGMRTFGKDKPGPQPKGKHYLVAPDIQIEGDRATVESYHLGVSASPNGPEITSMGRYLDVLVRCPDGRWRIKERHLAKEGANIAGQKHVVGSKH
jgi:ketosteroid isomerase-like protein